MLTEKTTVKSKSSFMEGIDYVLNEIVEAHDHRSYFVEMVKEQGLTDEQRLKFLDQFLEFMIIVRNCDQDENWPNHEFEGE